jgi:hypothetical protein
MRSRLAWASLAVVLGTAVYAGAVQATPPSGVTPTIFGVGKFGAIDTKGKIGTWSAQMKTTGATDIHVLQNRIAPGGTFGWHSHPGPSFVISSQGRRRSTSAPIPPAHLTGIQLDRDSWIRASTSIWCGTRQRGSRDRRRVVCSSGRNEANRPTRPRTLPLQGLSDRRRVGRPPLTLRLGQESRADAGEPT